jgi:prevent-host-death family protein
MDISVKEAKNQLTNLLRRVEAGEKITVTRDGQPVVDLVKHVPRKRGLNWEALRAFKKEHGIEKVVEWISPDFDDPLPEDFLITPNADEKYLTEQAKRKQGK